MENRDLDHMLEIQKQNTAQYNLMLEIMRESGKDSPRYKTIRLAMVCVTILSIVVASVFFGYLMLDSLNIKYMIQCQNDLKDTIENMEVVVNTDAIAINGKDKTEITESEERVIGVEDNNK